MRELFIYYRVRSHDVPAAHAAVVELQLRLRERHPGLSARLLCRDEGGGTSASQTWMEIYAIDPMHRNAGISSELQAEIEVEAHSLSALIDGVRHTEAFNACAW
jgi:hypothetical protein